MESMEHRTSLQLTAVFTAVKITSSMDTDTQNWSWKGEGAFFRPLYALITYVIHTTWDLPWSHPYYCCSTVEKGYLNNFWTMRTSNTHCSWIQNWGQFTLFSHQKSPIWMYTLCYVWFQSWAELAHNRRNTLLLSPVCSRLTWLTLQVTLLLVTTLTDTFTAMITNVFHIVMLCDWCVYLTGTFWGDDDYVFFYKYPSSSIYQMRYWRLNIRNHLSLKSVSSRPIRECCVHKVVTVRMITTMM